MQVVELPQTTIPKAILLMQRQDFKISLGLLNVGVFLFHTEILSYRPLLVQLPILPPHIFQIIPIKGGVNLAAFKLRMTHQRRNSGIICPTFCIAHPEVEKGLKPTLEDRG